MIHPLDRPLRSVAAALRRKELSASELLDEALARHERQTPALGAYIHLDRDAARSAAAEADRRLEREGPDAPV
ncbi:MAG: amidase, partial [Gemmatimonadetes bacterium]|nr:amidase [Gemmatimonadota bacterium]NNK64215.1 amidase [Gemmatimonadota bacterium]